LSSSAPRARRVPFRRAASTGRHRRRGAHAARDKRVQDPSKLMRRGLPMPSPSVRGRWCTTTPRRRCRRKRRQRDARDSTLGSSDTRVRTRGGSGCGREGGTGTPHPHPYPSHRLIHHRAIGWEATATPHPHLAADLQRRRQAARASSEHSDRCAPSRSSSVSAERNKLCRDRRVRAATDLGTPLPLLRYIQEL
jgi:hypothetical protein